MLASRLAGSLKREILIGTRLRLVLYCSRRVRLVFLNYRQHLADLSDLFE